MSRGKALRPNRRLRQSRKIDHLSGVAQQSFRSNKLGWLEIASSQPSVAIPVTSTGNDRDDDDDCGNNDGRRTGSMAGNRIDNKVWRNTGTDKSTRKGNIRNTQDRTRY